MISDVPLLTKSIKYMNLLAKYGTKLQTNKPHAVLGKLPLQVLVQLRAHHVSCIQLFRIGRPPLAPRWRPPCLETKALT